MCNACCWIEAVPLAHTKIRFCISTGAITRAFCCGAASVACESVINELTHKMMVTPIATVLFTALNHFPNTFICLLMLPFPTFTPQLTSPGNVYFQSCTEASQTDLDILLAVQVIDTDVRREFTIEATCIHVNCRAQKYQFTKGSPHLYCSVYCSQKLHDNKVHEVGYAEEEIHFVRYKRIS